MSGGGSLLQKLHLGFQGRAGGLAQGWAAWGPRALVGPPGCADLTERVWAYWVLVGGCSQALSPRRASGEASGSSEALGDHFCGLEKALETGPGHLPVGTAWQMWIFLLVATLGVGLLLNHCPCWLWISASASQPGTVLPSQVVHLLQNHRHRLHHRHHRHLHRSHRHHQHRLL